MNYRSFLVASMLSVITVAASGCAADSEDADSVETGAVAQDITAALSWQNLGTRQVDGGIDHDSIIVGADEGAFRAIKIKVQGSDLVMFDIKITFGNGEVFSPNTRLVFNENSTSRVIDLPGEARFIKRVDFRYANLPGGGRAQVQLVGKTTAPSLWESMGEKKVDGLLLDHDVIRMPADQAPVTAIKIRVEDSSLVMFNIKVTFGNGETFFPTTRLVFDENTASRVIDLPGQARNIKTVEFSYANLPGGGKASVQLFGKTVAPPPWQGLGQRVVDGFLDADRINVGVDEGAFKAIQLKVTGSDLVMFDVKVTFGNGEVFSPDTRFVFDEGTKSRVIDLPGNARFIKRVDFRYANLPGGGNARVQLLGKR